MYFHQILVMIFSADLNCASFQDQYYAKVPVQVQLKLQCETFHMVQADFVSVKVSFKLCVTKPLPSSSGSELGCTVDVSSLSPAAPAGKALLQAAPPAVTSLSSVGSGTPPSVCTDGGGSTHFGTV